MVRASVAVLFVSAVAAYCADPVLVVDRGLPQSNLNMASGDSRANIRFSSEDHGFVGDDFTIGSAGETWVIDSIRTWAVPPMLTTSSRHLGDLYQDIRLYFGASGSALTPILSTTLTQGSDTADNAAVKLTDLTQTGATPYEEFGRNLRVVQVDFTGLNLTVAGGSKLAFGVWGMGRPTGANDGKIYSWFNLGSNAALSAAREDGADNSMLLYDGGGKLEGPFNSQGQVWDKSADINVQVFAHRQ